MDNYEIIALIASGIVTIAIAAAILIPVIVRENRLKKGVYGRLKIYSALKRFASFRNFKVLSNVTIKQGGKSAYFENIMVSFYGIMAVSTINDKSEYYGERRARNWTKITESGDGKSQIKESVANIVLEGEDNMSLLREVFSHKKIYGLQIEQFVVLTRRKKHGAAQCFLSGCPEILKFSEFKKNLHKVKYEKDNDVDVDAVVAAITAAGENK
ncbi:MAG: hypothetical protein E7487_08505 [Ruminococcaceae bacterium]|nr:hypothetical protein [Oscillospiraceae bacterium]